MAFVRPTWPKGVRCVVSLSFDNFGESYDLLRYGHAGGANADGVYAPRRGIERVLELLQRHSIPATFFAEGWGARKYASLAHEVLSQGHEIGAHGWMHEDWGSLEPERERELVRRTTETLGDVLGHRPTGWRAPGGLTSPDTLSILHQNGYDYDSSFSDDDTPYLVDVAPGSSQQILELPWTWPLDDAVFYAHPGTMRRPSEVVQLWMEEFDTHYELTGCFMLVCHPRFAGRPARIRALETLVEHIKGHDGVWFARCDELARAARSWIDIPHHAHPVRMLDEDH